LGVRIPSGALIIDDMTSSISARCWAVAFALIAATGCQHDTPSAEPSNPSAAAGPTQREGVIQKRVGEPAGLNCPTPRPILPDKTNSSCDSS